MKVLNSSVAAIAIVATVIFMAGGPNAANAATCTGTATSGSSTCENSATDLTSVSPAISTDYTIDSSSQFFGNANPSSTEVADNISGLVTEFPTIGSLGGIQDIGSGITATNSSGGTGTFSLASGSGSKDWGISEGDSFLLLVFSSFVNSITIDVAHGIHDVFAFNDAAVGSVGSTPLPATLPMLGSVLAGVYLISRWRGSRSAGSKRRGNRVPA